MRSGKNQKYLENFSVISLVNLNDDLLQEGHWKFNEYQVLYLINLFREKSCHQFFCLYCVLVYCQ